MKFLYTVFVFVMASQLLACAKPLSIEPRYNSETKVLAVGGLIFNNVTYYNKKENRISGTPTVIEDIEYFKIDDSVCPEIQVVRTKVSSGGYFYYSMKEDLMRRYSDACLTRRINNVNSLRCQDDLISDPYLYLTSSTAAHSGIGSKTLYAFTSNNCLKKFESHYLEISNPKGVGSYNSNKLSEQHQDRLNKLIDDN